MQIVVDVVEMKAGRGKVVTASAAVQVTAEVGSGWNWSRLASLRDRLQRVLDDGLCDCIDAEA